MKKQLLCLILPAIILSGAMNVSFGQDPCLSITTIDAGTTYPFSLDSGDGYLNMDCSGSDEEGNEIIYEYTATATGVHAIDVLTNNNAVALALMYKESSGGCNSVGWSCINGWFVGTPSNYITLTSGISYYFMFDRTNSTSGTSTISFELIAPGTVDPCTTITDISCGTINELSLGNGLGFINTQCYGGDEYGEEAIYTFTPTITGMHALDVVSSNHGDALLFAYKEAGDGCNSTGWTCLGENGFTPSYYMNLVQDVTYYFLFDKLRNNRTNSHDISFKISCPVTVDPCTTITPIYSCNEVYYITLGAGLGFINTQCFGGDEYGEEEIFSFTAPQSGTFSLDMLSSNFNGPLLFAWKLASSGCNSEGWTCEQEFTGTPSFSLSLTEGSEYYFLFDNRRDNPTGTPSYSFKISCPTTGDPCLDMLTVNECGTSFNISLTTGTGSLDANCSGSNEQGKEQVFSFTPVTSGLHGIGITSNNNGDALSLSYKEASVGCNSTGWNCINNGFTGTPEYFLSLVGGTEYFFLFDRLYNSTTSTETFTVKFICQGATDPCTVVTSLTCGTTRTDTIRSSLGYLNASCSGSDEEGEEKIYSFTPTVTGIHTIDFQSNNNADGMAILYKEAGSGCDNTGWTCISNNFSGTGNLDVTLTESVPYYIMFDREFTNQDSDEIYSFVFVPDNIVLTDNTISDGQQECFLANETITVAGDGNDYILSNGGSLSLVAGTQILIKYGFQAEPGSYFHAYIGTEGCTGPLNPIIITPREEKIGESLAYKDELVLYDNQITDKDYIRVYPNPTTGALNIEILPKQTQTVETILIYDFLGNLIYVHETMGSTIIVLDLSTYPNGMYLVRFIVGKESETVKVMKYY